MEELVQQAKLQPDAFGQIYDMTVNALFRYCMVLTNGDSDRSWDLCSETYLRALETIQRYESQGYQFTSYLYRIARNLHIDEIRKKKREQVEMHSIVDEDGEIAGDDEDMPDTLLMMEEEEVERKGFLQELKKHIGSLPQEEQEMLHMRFEKDMQYKEIGEVLGLPLSTVKVRFHRLFKKLQSRFAPPSLT